MPNVRSRVVHTFVEAYTRDEPTHA
jgi:hypothetical protein